MGRQEEKGCAGLLPSAPELRAVSVSGSPGSLPVPPGQEQGQSPVSDVCLTLWPAAKSPSKSTRALQTSNHGGWVFLEANQSVVTVQVQTSQTQPAKLHRSAVCRGRLVSLLVQQAVPNPWATRAQLFLERAVRSVNRLWTVKHTLFNSSNKLQNWAARETFFQGARIVFWTWSHT